MIKEDDEKLKKQYIEEIINMKRELEETKIKIKYLLKNMKMRE